MPAATNAPARLHVLTLTPFFPSNENEVNGCFIAEPIEQFKQFGIDSSVVAVSPLHHARRSSSSSAPADWVRFPQIPRNLGLSTAGELLYARLVRHVSQLHRVKPIDVIHAHGPLPCGDASALLSRHLGIPFVVTVHGLDVFALCGQAGISAKWRRQKSVALYEAARTVICISDKVRQILDGGMPADVRSAVVYNGTDVDLFSPTANTLVAPGKEVLVVGTLIASKGHALVLRAIDRLQNLFPALRCQIIGEGPDRARFETLASQLGIAHQVRFLGRQSRVAVADAMRACSLFVLPSCNEGLGCVYLEAMACGKPAIACHGQGIDEIIQHGKNGWLIPANGLEELVQGMATLLQSTDLATRIGNAGRETIVNGLTLRDQAERLASVYREAMA
jgi:glycosyltransferase involved in cell wall biosynthesis